MRQLFAGEFQVMTELDKNLPVNRRLAVGRRIWRHLVGIADLGRLTRPGTPGLWAGLRQCRRGAAALEFALASVPLMMIIFGFFATNAIFLTLATMQNNVQYAVGLMATGQITSFQSAAVSCAGTYTTSQAEYYACKNLPSWATFTVTATESCTSPASVTVKLTVGATSAAIADIFSFYSGKTLQALATNMKQGTCP